MPDSPWLAFPGAAAPAACQLLCFPFAGGGASFYRGWAARSSPALAVLPVQLAGREYRLAEPPETDMPRLLEALERTLLPLLGRRLALFGHSLGALIAAALAQRLTLLGRPPCHLFVSGAAAPHLPRRRPALHLLPDDAFARAIAALNGTPPAVLEHPRLMELFLPILRADCRLGETFRLDPGQPLGCDVTVLAADDDPFLDRDNVPAWAEITRGRTTIRRFPGDHFYLLPILDALFRDVVRPGLGV